jgi:hypothetical protein
MGKVRTTVSPADRLECYAAAVDMVKESIKDERNYVNPETKVGNLSLFEWDKLASAMVSGWIIARSTQVVGELVEDPDIFLATGEIPEPRELGVVASVLPALGEFVEKMGLTDKTIGAWSKDDICMFVWNAVELVNRVREEYDRCHASHFAGAENHGISASSV